MTEDRAPKVADEPTSTARQRPERKKRKWDQPAEDLVSAAATSAAVAGLPLMNISALPGVALASPAAIATPTLPSVVPVPYALPPQIPPSVLQNAAAVVQKLSQAKLPDEIIAREVVINDADPSVRYKLTKRQTQEEIQRCTNTIIITRGKYKPPNGQPNDEKPLYLHISAGSQLKDTAERIKAVDRAASMIEEIMKQGQIPETASVPFLSGCGQAVHPFSASVFLGFDADPLLNVAARIRGPNDQYINHIMNETGVTVVLRGKGSGNLGSFQGEASQQPLHLYLSGMHLKNLEAAKVLAENLLDTIAAEFGAFRISSSKVYGAVPPPQQLLTGVHTSGTVSDSDVHSTLEPNVLTGASHSFASSGIAASLIAPSEALQSRAPTYVGALPPCNVTCPAPPVNGGAFYSGYGNIYPQATPLQQVASTLKHSISLTTQVVPVTTTLTSTAINATSSSDLETDKRSQRRKFQELPVSKGPTAEFQNSQQGSEFVKTGLSKFGNVRSSSIAHPNNVQTGSDGMLPSNQVDIPSHLSASNEMAPPPSNIMMPPPSRNMLSPLPHRSMPPPPPQMSMPPPPPKFPSGEMMPKKANMSLVSPEPVVPPRSLNTRSVLPPKLCAQLPAKEPSDGKPNVAPVSDTLLRLMDYGDEDDDDI